MSTGGVLSLLSQPVAVPATEIIPRAGDHGGPLPSSAPLLHAGMVVYTPCYGAAEDGRNRGHQPCAIPFTLTP